MNIAARAIRKVSWLTRMLGLGGAIAFSMAWVLRREVIRAHVRGFSKPFFVRRKDSDLIVLIDVFVNDDSNVTLPWTPRFILDAGANAGFVTAMYARRYPTAKIIAVEPSHANAELLRRNCAGFNNVEIMEAGIWTSSAHLEIENPDEMSWAFRVREVASPTARSFRGMTIHELADRFGPGAIIDICKLDIEGTERELMRAGWELWIDRVRCIVMELHGPEAHQLYEQFVKLRPFRVSRAAEKVVMINEALIPLHG